MQLLDLYCGAGDAAMGYHRAGFDEIVGVDIKQQPRYPFEFIQGDALQYAADLEWVSQFDAIHASPPCQGYTWASAKDRNNGKQYPMLVQQTIELLKQTGVDWVVENVNRTALPEANLMLCGEMFGLGVIRHRYFQTSFFMLQPEHVPHKGLVKDHYCTVAGNGGHSRSYKLSDWREAMGIDWMNKKELSESIPPAYTEYIGKHLIEHIGRSHDLEA